MKFEKKSSARMRAALVLICLLGAGCASLEEPPPLPAHPFPRWVSQLETGSTQAEEIEARFGSPDSVEESVRGGVTWRYAFSEIEWPDDDPLRPSVASDGSLVPPKPSAFHKASRFLGKGLSFFDRMVSYPASQPRKIRKRRLPATIHQLEVRFRPDGTLRHFVYAPVDGDALVSAGH